MISAHTPPGTKVVALRNFDPRITGFRLREGAVYTVDFLAPTTDGDISVALHEFDHRIVAGGSRWLWPRRFFRPAELPRCLTDLLKTAPVPSPEDAHA